MLHFVFPRHQRCRFPLPSAFPGWSDARFIPRSCATGFQRASLPLPEEPAECVRFWRVRSAGTGAGHAGHA